MFGSLEANALEQIHVVETLITTHDEFIRAQPTERRSAVKVYAVTSCVTRLYAIYERFVESLISDFLDAIPELIPYCDLSDGLKKEYRVGVSHVLSKLDEERYSHLAHENVILWYHEALTSTDKYRFVTEALTHHDRNLRLSVVERLVSRVNLKDLRGWLTHSEEITALYEEQTAIVEQLDAELRAFVQLRNEAAHGVLEALEGKDNLARYCALIQAIVRALAAYFSRNLLLQRIRAGKAKRIGLVTETFASAGAFIAQLDNGAEVQLGMYVHLLSSNYCMSQSIVSLQVMNVNVDRVVANQLAYEVGVKCAVNPRRHAVIYVDA